MPLADFQPAKRKIAFPGGDFDVRALSLMDISLLVEAHRQAVDQIALSIRVAREMSLSDEDTLKDVVLECIRESPLLVSNIISLCSDEPDQQMTVMKLPATVQTEALLAIVEITFKDTAAIKKLAADVMKLIQGILPPKMITLAAAE
jgi:hypothetical protein